MTIGRWFRMFWPRRSRRPSQDAASGLAQAEASLVTAERERARSRRLREVAENVEADVRSHNTANRYAAWLEHTVRGDE